MQAPAAAPAAGAGPAPQQQTWMGTIFKFLMIYMAYQYLFAPKGPKPVDSTGKVLPPHRNAWLPSTPLDLYVYLSEDPYTFRADDLVWEQHGLSYDSNDSNNRELSLDVDVNEHMLSNGTVYTHAVITQAGVAPYKLRDGDVEITRGEAVIHQVHPQVKYMKRLKAKDKKNLISGEKEDVTAVAQDKTPSYLPTEYIPYWKPNVTVNLVEDFTAYPRGGIPPNIANLIKIDADGKYKPVLYFNEFWQMKGDLIAINNTLRSVPLTLSYSILSMWKWQLYLQMQQSFEMQGAIGSLGGMGEEVDEGGEEEVKRMLLDTNPILLGVTFAVSLLHSVFDFLAFKNDIQFWRSNNSMEGLSVKSILLNAGCQFIIFLYLLDNDTSLLILVSVGVGVLIELWKVQKAMVVKVDWSGSVPRVSFTDKASYSSRTKEFDEYAMKYLSYVLYVLVVGYAVYSLMYETHKSWYSWILGSLVGTVYTFGFVMMTPQLFINYKLKSVAHLPWRVFMYKALNTFIDDLFAFIIKMPTLHRLSVLRDDLIFIIYLYQRWIYPVDKKRTNEFGQSFEDSSVPPAVPALASPVADIPPATTLLEDAQDEEGDKKEKKQGQAGKRTAKPRKDE
eukprot:TRINITY_DN8962_c0_g1_i4.p1 TRINITY_DN8962_c0_g1~~TRINITY_DN8962_c0_g1_i4.p1  ORF type:complete len:617 (-),score=137.18 TRINITY_DN8962_c0_g1_i4:94-1944(-)